MHLHKQLLESIGGTREIATALGVSDDKVSKWKKTGIAMKYAEPLITFARKKGVEPKLCDFFNV